MSHGDINPWRAFDGHEEVVVAEHAGVQMVIALHSTVLGPAMGGTRISAYADHDDPGAAAYADALRLSRAMTYKNALAGLDHGGGKGVIVVDPAQKTDEILLAYGRLVASLGGRYVTAGDVGATVADLDLIGEVCPWTTGRSEAKGGVGDSAILTAVGVFAGLRAAAAFAWGSPDLAGRRVGVVGAGKVGGRLIAHLTEAGAQVIAVDPHAATREAVQAKTSSVRFVPDVDTLLAESLDVLSPNAMGGFLTPELAARVHARIICGAANNQLADPAVAEQLQDRGIIYAPDFLVNCGGVIQISEELTGHDLDRARGRAERVYETTGRVLERAHAEGITPVAAAEQEAEDRIRRAAGGGAAA